MRTFTIAALFLLLGCGLVLGDDRAHVDTDGDGVPDAVDACDTPFVEPIEGGPRLGQRVDGAGCPLQAWRFICRGDRAPPRVQMPPTTSDAYTTIAAVEQVDGVTMLAFETPPGGAVVVDEKCIELKALYRFDVKVEGRRHSHTCVTDSWRFVAGTEMRTLALDDSTRPCHFDPTAAGLDATRFAEALASGEVEVAAEVEVSEAAENVAIVPLGRGRLEPDGCGISMRRSAWERRADVSQIDCGPLRGCAEAPRIVAVGEPALDFPPTSDGLATGDKVTVGGAMVTLEQRLRVTGRCNGEIALYAHATSFRIAGEEKLEQTRQCVIDTDVVRCDVSPRAIRYTVGVGQQAAVAIEIWATQDRNTATTDLGGPLRHLLP